MKQYLIDKIEWSESREFIKSVFLNEPIRDESEALGFSGLRPLGQKDLAYLVHLISDQNNVVRVYNPNVFRVGGRVWVDVKQDPPFLYVEKIGPGETADLYSLPEA